MKNLLGFRPQQGLPIINLSSRISNRKVQTMSFRPQQGLPIINYLKQFIKNIQFGFRPQQGLPIINL